MWAEVIFVRKGHFLVPYFSVLLKSSLLFFSPLKKSLLELQWQSYYSMFSFRNFKYMFRSINIPQNFKFNFNLMLCMVWSKCQGFFFFSFFVLWIFTCYSTINWISFRLWVFLVSAKKNTVKMLTYFGAIVFSYGYIY